MKQLDATRRIRTVAQDTKPASVKILDGQLTLYMRSDANIWWAGFYNKRIHIRTSTKTADFEAAKKVAQQWYFEKQLQIAGGNAPTTRTRTFRAVATKALEQYSLDAERGKRSKQYVNGLRKVFNRLNVIIGDNDIDNINQAKWTQVKQDLQNERALTDKTLHQYRTALQIVLKQAVLRGEMDELPKFFAEPTGNANDTPRTWFDEREYRTMILALRRNIATHKKNKTRWQEDATELRDYVLLVSNTGMRPGEAQSVRFCDVTITSEFDRKSGKELEYLEIRNILGKRGRHGICKSYFGAVPALKRCIERHGLSLDNYMDSENKVFRAYHRDMFREVLTSANLYKTNDRPPRKRDLQSLRSTYICMRLTRGVPVYDVANNCRTSVAMIEKHYARYLSILSSKSINQSSFGSEDDEKD